MSNSNPKRERQKRLRDEKRAAEWAAWRRRRMIRIAGILVFVVVLGIAIGSSIGDDGGSEPSDPAAPAPTASADANAGIACDGPQPPEASPQEYEKPKQVLREGVDYSAVISTSCGDIVVDLLEDEAPETVNNFVFLAQEGYFDGLLWHRIERNFVIQTGDPNGLNGTPPDGPGYAIKDELPGKTNEYQFGTVAMANSGPDTGGSQFFIITQPDGPAGLPKQYAIFGQADESSRETIEALNVLEVIGGAATSPAEASMPKTPAYINSIKIIEN